MVALARTLAYLPWSFSPKPSEARTLVRRVAVTAGIEFLPTVANTVSPPLRAQAGMVWIAGGEFSMDAVDPPPARKPGCMVRWMHTRFTICTSYHRCTLTLQ
jgi:formylglycine-generating enzyme required for sulfatase activity